jgi:predicted RNase H-like nuclease (RuvC/YqgF family)
MTKEELENEAEVCMHNALFWLKLPISKENVEKGGSYILKLLEPREKQIEIDAKQIRVLQKQNGELTDKVNNLEEKLANADYQLEGRDNEIRELKEKIEKMKCCGNCRFSESDTLNGTFCHREGCFVVASGEKCKLWEN